MKSETVQIADGSFSGYKVLLNGTSVFQVNDIDTAVQRASSLDTEATSFEYKNKDGDITEVEVK